MPGSMQRVALVLGYNQIAKRSFMDSLLPFFNGAISRKTLILWSSFPAGFPDSTRQRSERHNNTTTDLTFTVIFSLQEVGD